MQARQALTGQTLKGWPRARFVQGLQCGFGNSKALGLEAKGRPDAGHLKVPCSGLRGRPWERDRGVNAGSQPGPAGCLQRAPGGVGP